MQHVHAQGGARQADQAQLQALARVAVQGVGIGGALRGVGRTGRVREEEQEMGWTSRQPFVL